MSLPPPRLESRLFRWTLVLLIILISAYAAREMMQRAEQDMERRAAFLHTCENRLSNEACLEKWEKNRTRCHRVVSEGGSAVFQPREFNVEAFQRCVLLGVKAWRAESAKLTR